MHSMIGEEPIGSLRVMIADDSEDFRQVLRMRLGLIPDVQVVVEVSTGEEAIAALARIEVDLVLMDVKMPGIGGVDATRRLKAAPGPAVVLMSLADAEPLRRAAADSGADGYLGKRDVEEQLPEILARIRAERDLIVRFPRVGDGGAIARRLHETVVRALVDRVPEAIVVHDGVQVIHANRAARRLIAGDGGPELTGRSVDSLWRSEGEGGRVRIFVDAGRELTTRAAHVPVLLDPDWSVATFLTNPDELSIPVERLAALDRMQTAMVLAAGLAHEAAAPFATMYAALAEIRAQLPTLKDGGGADGDGRLAALVEGVDGAWTAAQELGALLRDHQGASGGAASCDPRPAIERAIRLARPRLPAATRLSVRLDPVTGVRISAGDLTQIALNLLNNAADALIACKRDAAAARLDVRLHVEEGRAVLEVEDDGPGIPAEISRRLFQPYVTTKADGRSHGLGLSICRALAQRSGGDIEVTSLLGRGSTFRVSLPIAARADA